MKRSIPDLLDAEHDIAAGLGEFVRPLNNYERGKLTRWHAGADERREASYARMEAADRAAEADAARQRQQQAVARLAAASSAMRTVHLAAIRETAPATQA